VLHLAELHHHIEELALRTVLGGEGSSGSDAASRWVADLEDIRSCALRASAEPLAQIASNLLEAICHEPAANYQELLHEGIPRLQKALENLDRPAEKTASLTQDPELLSDFVLESREHLASLEAQILTLERDPDNSEALHSVFRSFHTMKGLAGFLELGEVQKLAHEVETILDKARNSQLKITPATIDVVLESADYLRRWLAHLESVLQNHASVAPARDQALLNKVLRLSTDSAAPNPESVQDLAGLAAAVGNGGERTPTPERSVDTRRHSEATAVKVDTTKLDYLADMAGEMVIAETLVRHDPEIARIDSPRLQRNLAQLTRITAELQKTAMAMRLVPIGPLFRRMARLVRDLSRQFGKAVEMQTEGDEIELDRTIVEELADPLMHMVRNSLDHGIESPEQRQALGKPTAARLLLKAQHQAG
jgi:two-component system chemotaxis sensor kinase CheA